MPSFELSVQEEKKMTESREYPLLPEGDYEFTVLDAEDAVSAAGNEMINMTLQVWDESGKDFKVWDRLVFTPKALYRIRNFCKANGLDEQWEAREVTTDDVTGVTGTAHIGIDPERVVNGKTHKAKNVVDYYIEPDAAPAAKASGDDFDNSDIPF